MGIMPNHLFMKSCEHYNKFPLHQPSNSDFSWFPFYDSSKLEAAAGEINISWRLRGMTLMNMLVAMCIAPANHKKWEMIDRAETALAGFALVDLFGLVAQSTCRRLSWPKGSTWMAHQTSNNLQQVCLGVLSVCLSKSQTGNPWIGTNRLNEISVEEHFGRVRSSSANAQVTARAYWRAVAKECLLRADRPRAPPQPLEELPPLTDEQFRGACERALSSALDLVSRTSGVPVDALEKMYRDACQGEVLDPQDLESLEPDPLEADESDQVGVEAERKGAQATAAKESENLLRNIQFDAASQKCDDEDVNDEQELRGDQQTSSYNDLGDLPDLDAFQKMASASAQDPADGDVEQVSMSKLPTTLSDALKHVDNGRPFWDSIWRLVLFLRHG